MQNGSVATKADILVVDDDPDISQALLDFLQYDGYHVDLAATGFEALARSKQLPYSAVILDLGLPDLDGLVVLKKLQEHDPELPIIILTAFTAPERTAGVVGQGAFALLTKPYNREQLRGTLRRAIGVKVLATRVETAESALSASENRFQSVVQSTTDTIVLADGRGHIMFWNKAAERMFLYSEQEALGQSLTTIMSARYRDAHERGMAAFRSTGESRIMGTSVELQGLRKDGMEIPIELSLGTWSISGDTYYCGIIRDITERKRMEQAQAEQVRLATLQELILNSAGDGIYGLDMQGSTTFVNPAAARMLSWTREGLIGRPMHSTLHHSKADGAPYPAKECPIYAAIKEGKPYSMDEEVFWRKDGSCFPVEYISTPILELGTVVGAVVIFKDITERKSMELALRDSEERFRQVTEHILDVFWMTDLEKNRMLYVSPGYQEIWGRSCESLYASPQSWLDAIHPDDQDHIRQASTMRQVLGQYAEQYRIIRPDGSIRWIRDRAFPIRDASGIVYRIAGIAQDITELKRGSGW
ncbi:MAG: PAS domain S-box protein [Nitrospirales bacterium]|nr:PAS domain S-box protein [Nitrospirales bacterium]